MSTMCHMGEDSPLCASASSSVSPSVGAADARALPSPLSLSVESSYKWRRWSGCESWEERAEGGTDADSNRSSGGGGEEGE